MDELKIKRHQITAKTYRGVELVPIENIYYFLADQKYVTVRHKNGSVLIDETLKDLESEFGDQFIRIHRNALVSIQFLEGLDSQVPKTSHISLRCPTKCNAKITMGYRYKSLVSPVEPGPKYPKPHVLTLQPRYRVVSVVTQCSTFERLVRRRFSWHMLEKRRLRSP